MAKTNWCIKLGTSMRFDKNFVEFVDVLKILHLLTHSYTTQILVGFSFENRIFFQFTFTSTQTFSEKIYLHVRCTYIPCTAYYFSITICVHACYWMFNIQGIHKNHWFLRNEIFSECTCRLMQQNLRQRRWRCRRWWTEQKQRKLLDMVYYHVVKLPMTLCPILCTVFDCLSPRLWSKRLHLLQMPFYFVSME